MTCNSKALIDNHTYGCMSHIAWAKMRKAFTCVVAAALITLEKGNYKASTALEIATSGNLYQVVMQDEKGGNRPGAADERRVDQGAVVVIDVVDDKVNGLLQHISHSKWIHAQ